jgi:hypothetical protein
MTKQMSFCEEAGAADGDEGHVANGGKGFDATAGEDSVGGDFCPGLFGREGVADPDGHTCSGDGT